MVKLDLTDQRFGMWTAKSHAFTKQSNGMSYWSCVCDCGNIKEIALGSLRSGQSKSCGCSSHLPGTDSPNFRHGKSRTKVHKVWSHIKDRCHNENCHSYPSYGAKGIRMEQDLFNNFEIFYQEVGEPPSAKHSIDRIDYTIGYVKGNMRWATTHQQARNKGKTKSNTSGVNGVQFAFTGKSNHSTYVIATWYDLDGRARNKKFNCKKLGLLPAFKAAFEYRKAKIAELNANGADYAFNHGQ